LGLPDGFARRIARNLQTLLLEESNLYKVTDPAAGSGFVESLTTEIAQQAWSLFQSVEKAGGMITSLEAGLIAGWVEEAKEGRAKLLASRKNALTGASAFPDIHEEAVEVEAVATVPAPELAKEGIHCPALKPQRLAEPYEALREAARAAGEAPSVFFANMGRIADYTARATWAKNFFEAGGVAALSDQGFDNAEAAVEAFKDSKAEITCLVGSDALYEEMGADFAKALKEAGAKMVYLAGRPKDLMDALSAAGVDAFAFEGCDVLAELSKIHAELGIQPVAQG
jgi:methylmalonyl-CoA mutase